MMLAQLDSNSRRLPNCLPLAVISPALTQPEGSFPGFRGSKIMRGRTVLGREAPLSFLFPNNLTGWTRLYLGVSSATYLNTIACV